MAVGKLQSRSTSLAGSGGGADHLMFTGISLRSSIGHEKLARGFCQQGVGGL